MASDFADRFLLHGGIDLANVPVHRGEGTRWNNKVDETAWISNCHKQLLVSRWQPSHGRPWARLRWLPGTHYSSNYHSMFWVCVSACDNKLFSFLCLQTSQDLNSTISTLIFTPAVEDSGLVLSCRAENPRLPNSVLVDSWTLDIHREYRPQNSKKIKISVTFSKLCQLGQPNLETEGRKKAL